MEEGDYERLGQEESPRSGSNEYRTRRGEASNATRYFWTNYFYFHRSNPNLTSITGHDDSAGISFARS